MTSQESSDRDLPVEFFLFLMFGRTNHFIAFSHIQSGSKDFAGAHKCSQGKDSLSKCEPRLVYNN